ncbi:MAG: serpin family protein, partial [Prevotellaceae bacterium]|nr:serpin family protein [Prevotellaceae bacterium]
LPEDDLTLEKTTEKLTAENWERWMNGLWERKANLHLPKFTMKYERTMNDDLKALGMPTAFTGDADFSKMSDTPFSISKVLQKTYISVSETGTTAAAATVVLMEGNSAVPRMLNIFVHHPFIYAIKELSTGTILFMGRVSEL